MINNSNCRLSIFIFLTCCLFLTNAALRAGHFMPAGSLRVDQVTKIAVMSRNWGVYERPLWDKIMAVVRASPGEEPEAVPNRHFDAAGREMAEVMCCEDEKDHEDETRLGFTHVAMERKVPEDSVVIVVEGPTGLMRSREHQIQMLMRLIGRVAFGEEVEMIIDPSGESTPSARDNAEK